MKLSDEALSAVVRWGTWTRTKTNGTRNRRAANYPIPHGTAAPEPTGPPRRGSNSEGLRGAQSKQRPVLAQQGDRLRQRQGLGGPEHCRAHRRVGLAPLQAEPL